MEKGKGLALLEGGEREELMLNKLSLQFLRFINY